MDKDKAFIEHILEAIGSIEKYTEDISKENFMSEKNKMVQDAVIREFEIIGEAVRKLSETIKSRNPDLPWRDIAGMRNKLIHEYFGVDIAVVWKTIEADLPILKKVAQKALESFTED